MWEIIILFLFYSYILLKKFDSIKNINGNKPFTKKDAYQKFKELLENYEVIKQLKHTKQNIYPKSLLVINYPLLIPIS